MQKLNLYILGKIHRFILDVIHPQRIIHRRIKGIELRFFCIGDMSEAMIEKALHEEPYTIDWIINMPEGNVFYDVGANMGIYSIIAALTGKIVYAFEPMPYNLHLLYRNMQINHLSNARLYPVPIALGFCNQLQWRNVSPQRDEPGTANIYDNGNITGIIPQISLDHISYGFFRPDYVKIDVDGPERDIIIGGWETLKLAKEIQIERRSECQDLLAQMDFKKEKTFNFYKNHFDDLYKKG